MINLVVNGVSYPFPQTGDVPYGDQVVNWATAVTNAVFPKSGGLWQLTGELDFGPNFGLKSAYYKSRSSNVASAGVLRLANTDSIKFRNAANNGDLALALSTDSLTFNGATVVLAGLGSIVNADVSASAAIARSKLASGTANHVVINDGSGVFSSEATLAKSRGGTGADNSSVTFPSTGTVVTRDASETLTNKTILLKDNPASTGLRLSVKDYGAVGDGSTDDTTAIQAAVTAAEALNCSTVYFPAGSYKLTGTVYMSKGTVLEGNGSNQNTAGQGTWLIHYSTGDCLEWNGSSQYNGVGGAIRNISIQKAGSSYNGGAAVALRNSYLVAPGLAGVNVGDTVTNNGNNYRVAAATVFAMRLTLSSASTNYPKLTFTVASGLSPAPVAGDIYTCNGYTYTVVSYSGTTLTCTTNGPSGAGSISSTGSLVKSSGTGTTPIAYTAYSFPFVTPAGTVNVTSLNCDDYRPGEFNFDRVFITGTSSGQWDYGVVVDGIGCNTPSTKGVRTVWFNKIRVVAVTTAGKYYYIKQSEHVYGTLTTDLGTPPGGACGIYFAKYCDDVMLWGGRYGAVVIEDNGTTQTPIQFNITGAADSFTNSSPYLSGQFLVTNSMNGSISNASNAFSIWGNNNTSGKTEIFTNAGLIVSPAVTSPTANAATTGFARLANSDRVSWRNSTNASDMAFGPSATGDGYLAYIGSDICMANGAAQSLWAKTVGFSTDYNTAVNGGGRGVPDACNVVIAHIASQATIAGWTLIMPASPKDGQTLHLVTDGTITTLTVTPNTGQTVRGGVTTVSSTSSVGWVYSSTDTTWYRIK